MENKIEIPNGEMCKEHTPIDFPFNEWEKYARENYDDDIEQTKCPKCGYWLFPEEM
jgi:hypothetical protein